MEWHLGQQEDATKGNIRGSSLLLMGRMVSLGLNFCVQVLTVRYLAKEDYGSFAYAMTIVGLASSFTVLGLDQATARFVPIYQERRDFAKMFGAMLVAVATAATAGFSFVVAIFALRHTISQHLDDQLAVTLLLIVISMAPVMAVEAVFLNLLAVFAKPRAIFFRRHIVGPGIRLGAVLLVVLTAGDVQMLAVAYLVGGMLGLGIYVVLMVQVLKQLPAAQDFEWRTINPPFKEILSFSIPLQTTSLFYISYEFLMLILLEYYHGTLEVAEIRAILPVVGLNMVVVQSFTLLYAPAAARMFTRQDIAGIRDLFGRTALWIAVVTFPVVAVTTSLAEPVTVLLFGERYADSGTYLAIMSAAAYTYAALGFTVQTLRTFRKIRYIMLSDVLAIATGLTIGFTLIPTYGPLGAAIGCGSMLLAHKVFHSIAMAAATGISLFQWKYVRGYLIIIASALGLLCFERLLDPPIPVVVVAIALVSLCVLVMNRRALDVADTFPELLRLPILGRLLAS